VGAKGSRLALRAGPPSVQHLAQVSRDRTESVLQLAPRQPSPAEQVPGLEDAAHDLQAFVADDRLRATAIHTFLEVAFEMDPANLPQQDGPAAVHAPAV